MFGVQCIPPWNGGFDRRRCFVLLLWGASFCMDGLASGLAGVWSFTDGANRNCKNHWRICWHLLVPLYGSYNNKMARHNVAFSFRLYLPHRLAINNGSNWNSLMCIVLLCSLIG